MCDTTSINTSWHDYLGASFWQGDTLEGMEIMEALLANDLEYICRTYRVRMHDNEPNNALWPVDNNNYINYVVGGGVMINVDIL